MNGSTRFDGKGLSAARVTQAYQVVSQVLKYAVKAKHLPANPVDGIELPRKLEGEQRYLTHEQLHRLGVRRANSAPWCWSWAIAGCNSPRQLRCESVM